MCYSQCCRTTFNFAKGEPNPYRAARLFFWSADVERGGSAAYEGLPDYGRGLARLLGRTPKAIRRMVERGQLPYRKLGRRILFLRAELNAYIERLYPASRPADVRKRWGK